ncbi:hypothetical protein [Shewanella sp.]|uniref:hypothetical protein n=1 Tax=Shewanella sp. TaxID=50422 RepID=UPI0040539F2C
MTEGHFQLNDANDYKHGLEDILQECPSLKWALCYAKIDSSEWSISDWLIHARIKLDVDIERGHFPIRYPLSDLESFGAIEFLAILAYPLPTENEKRLKFILANVSGVNKKYKLGLNTKERRSINRNRWKLTTIEKINYATDRGAERITKRLMHAQAVEHYLKEQVLFEGDNPKSFAQSLYAVMDLYSSEYTRRLSDPDDTKSNQRTVFESSKPVIHYSMAYWQVLLAEGRDPQDYLGAIVNPEWLPKVIAYGNNFLAIEHETSKCLTLARGDALLNFESEEKVFINQLVR